MASENLEEFSGIIRFCELRPGMFSQQIIGLMPSYMLGVRRGRSSPDTDVRPPPQWGVVMWRPGGPRRVQGRPTPGFYACFPHDPLSYRSWPVCIPLMTCYMLITSSPSPPPQKLIHGSASPAKEPGGGDPGRSRVMHHPLFIRRGCQVQRMTRPP